MAILRSHRHDFSHRFPPGRRARRASCRVWRCAWRRSRSLRGGCCSRTTACRRPANGRTARSCSMAWSIAGVFVAVADAPDAIGVLEQLRLLALLLVLQHAGQHHRQRLGVIDAVEGRQLVADHVRGPVLRHAAADQAVEGLRGAPHQVRPDRVVLRLGQRLRAFFDQRQQNRPRPGGLAAGRRPDRSCTARSCGRTRRRCRWPSDAAAACRSSRDRGSRTAGSVCGVTKNSFSFVDSRVIDRSAVHLRAGGRQRQHAADRQRIGRHAAPNSVSMSHGSLPS